MSVVVRVAAAVVAVAAVLGALTVPRVPSPEPTVDLRSALPEVAAAACPGPLTVPVGDIDPGDPDIAPESPTTDARVYGEGTLAELDGADGTQVTGGIGVASERVPRGDIAGLAMTTCLQPATDQWLVGGSTSIGSSARLVLSNPSRAAVDVEVTVYGPVGEVDQQAIVIVAPGQQETVLIEALAVALPAVVVRVQSTGVGVSAVLQDSRLDGIQPAGTDWVVASALGDALVIPAVGNPGDSAVIASTVRLMSPEGATAHLGLVTPDGLEVWGGVGNLELEPGVVVEVDVPYFPSAAIEVRADAPVVAAARTTVQRPATEGLEGDIAHDHRWVVADTTERRVRSAVVGRTNPQLWMYFPVAGEVTVVDAEGAVVATVQQSARRLAVVDLDVPPGTVVSTDGRVVWALVHTETPGFVSAVQPVSYVPEQVSVAVEDAGYTGTGAQVP